MREVRWARRLAEASGFEVALLFQIPVQPVEGMQEDALLANRVTQFLASGDPRDLTHAAMVGAVLAAVRHLNQPTLLTGASKRGWTSWLAGFANDPLVHGIAPRVFDNFDFRRQLARQRELWGAISPMIADYDREDLVNPVEDPSFEPVLDLLDPVRSWHGLGVPALALAGTNDPYWAPDAWELIADRRPGHVELLYCPNCGHGLADERFWMPSLASFARRVLAAETEPARTDRWQWQATLDGAWHAWAHWKPVTPKTAIKADTQNYVAFLEEWRGSGSRRTSPVRVVPPASGPFPR